MFDLLDTLLGALFGVLLGVWVGDARARTREFRRAAHPFRDWIDRQLDAAKLDHLPSPGHVPNKETVNRIEALLLPWNRPRFRRIMQCDAELRRLGGNIDPHVGIIRQYSNELDIRWNLRRMRRFTVRR